MIKNSIDELRRLLDEKKITPEELFNESVNLAKEQQESCNAFVTIMDKFEKSNENSILSGIPYALKDNFSTSGILTTASSNILKDYVPVYDATVYRKLKESGAILMGKTVLDELAMGGTGTTAHTGIVKNPWDTSRIIGGSSSGSAVSVALGIVPFAIGSDTGDSVRKPAAFGGVVGFKPTYGRISRYGLFAFSSSLDHVGVLSRNVKEAAYVTDILKGYDENDMTTLPDDDKKYSETLDKDIKGKKLFYIKEICNIDNYDKREEELSESLNNFYETIEKAKEIGFIIDEVSMDQKLLNAIYPSYLAISCAEATSNNANLTGILYGPRGEGKNVEEIMFDSRTKGFSELIKRRFILGSYILQRENQEKLFLNAQRVRRMIVEKVNELFKIYDAMILPSSGGVAPKIVGQDLDRLSERYLALENHMPIGNFGGFPSVSIPNGFVNHMPTGVNITGRQFEDDLVLNIAYKLESQLGYKNQICKEAE